MRFYSYATTLHYVLGPTNGLAPFTTLLHRTLSPQVPTARSWTRLQVASPNSQQQDNVGASIDAEPAVAAPPPFVNDGPFKFMTEAFGLFGFEEGRSVIVAKAITVDESQFPSEEESAEMRRSAREKMINIGTYEQKRRKVVGDVALIVAAVLAVWTSLVDQDDILGHFTRFAVVVPLSIGVAYTRSAEAGLCNIAQGGLWDVDGTGMRKIDDPDLARAFLERMNTLNIGIGKDVLFASTVFASLPQGLTSPLAVWTMILTALYALSARTSSLSP